MSTRLEDLSARLKSPLLVTNLVNIRYLTGFDSSNAALLVRPGGETTLYTDFRYVETAREVPGVQVEMAKRALLVDGDESVERLRCLRALQRLGGEGFAA